MLLTTQSPSPCYLSLLFHGTLLPSLSWCPLTHPPWILPKFLISPLLFLHVPLLLTYSILTNVVPSRSLYSLYTFQVRTSTCPPCSFLPIMSTFPGGFLHPEGQICTYLPNSSFSSLKPPPVWEYWSSELCSLFSPLWSHVPPVFSGCLFSVWASFHLESLCSSQLFSLGLMI